MARSPSVEKVLNSKEFKTWMPGDRVHLDKTILRYPALVVACALCVGLIVSLFYSHHLDLVGFMIVTLAASCLAAAALVYFFGCRIERVIRFTRDEIEVWEGRKFLFRSQWDAIQTVHRIGKNGFVLNSDSAEVTIWLPRGIISSNEYEAFLRQVLIAMSGEDFDVSMGSYRGPTELEEGKTYEYVGQDRLKKRLKQAYLLIGAAVLFGFLSLIKRDFMGLLHTLLLGFLGFFLASEMRGRLRKSEQVWISVDAAHLLIHDGETTSPFPKYILEKSLTPEAKPIPFSKYEVYGDSKGSVRLDRRFLKERI